MMNKQEIFNKAVMGVVAQGRLATTGNSKSCFYRVEHSSGQMMACAVGQLISDDDYDKGMEGSFMGGIYGGKDLAQAHAVENTIGRRLLQDDINMLRSLQGCHDDAANSGTGVEGFLIQANILADGRGLTRIEVGTV